MRNMKKLLTSWHEDMIAKDDEISFFRLYSIMRNKTDLKFVLFWWFANNFYLTDHKRLTYRIYWHLKKYFSFNIMPGTQIGCSLTDNITKKNVTDNCILYTEKKNMIIEKMTKIEKKPGKPLFKHVNPIYL